MNTMTYVVTVDGQEERVTVTPRDDGRHDVTAFGATMTADLRRAGSRTLWSMILGSKSCELSVGDTESGFRIALRGASVEARVESEQERNARLVQSAGGVPRSQTVRANMPGFVTRVLVQTGDVVKKGTALVIIEAMKMENEIRAESPGTVKEISVREKQTVNKGDTLVVIGA